MFYVLVKFHGQSTPVIFGTTHVYHASQLATMDDVEWVSPNIANGQVIIEPRLNGGELRHGAVGQYVRGYYPNTDEISETKPDTIVIADRERPTNNDTKK